MTTSPWCKSGKTPSQTYDTLWATLLRGDVWAAVTANPAPLAGCDTLPLGRLRYIATASPKFIAQHFPQGVTAQALATAPSLIFNAKDRLQAQWAKLATGTNAPLPAHTLPSPQAFLEAARAGLGWGMNIEAIARADLAAGRLRALSPQPLDVALYWKTLRVMKARAEGRPSVPSRLSGERATNPFLRASRPEMKAALGMEGESDAAVFAELRARKDRF